MNLLAFLVSKIFPTKFLKDSTDSVAGNSVQLCFCFDMLSFASVFFHYYKVQGILNQQNSNQIKRMEDNLERFSQFDEAFFGHLDDKSLVTCREVSKSWRKFIDSKKLFWKRMLMNCIGEENNFLDSWEKITVKTSAKKVKVFAIAIFYYYQYLEKGNEQKTQEWSPLHVFADFNIPHLFQEIMKKVEDKSPRTDNGTTPLQIAASKGYFENCKIIIEQIEKSYHANNFGETAFHFAAKNGHFKICKLMLESFEDKNPTTNNGVTPLSMAAEHGHFKVCVLIIHNVEDKNPTQALLSKIKLNQNCKVRL